MGAEAEEEEGGGGMNAGGKEMSGRCCSIVATRVAKEPFHQYGTTMRVILLF